MTFAENHHRSNGGARRGARKPVNAIADRKLRYAFSLKCAEMAEEILEFYIDVFRDKNLSLSERQHAADWIVNRAFGRVPLPVDTTEEADRDVHHTYNVRWLPPDPNDRSVVVEEPS